MTRVSVSEACDDCDIVFKSDDQTFHLRQEGDWWTIDSVNDRGQRYYSTAQFSTFALVETYFIWEWASLTRSSVGALGARLHAKGVAPCIEIVPTERDYIVELRARTGRAIIPMSRATVFSHVMSKSADEIEQLVKPGIP
ncbi:hypothetical protein [Mycolicibacterium celeriflavum]|uniref:hypothetical protein n=1 Tax=Mycolicibacterium celeriflavum TaxID=1249101 RepID=UPI003CF96A0B